MAIYILLFIALVSPLLLAVPRRAKSWTALALVSAGAAVALGVALTALMAGGEVVLLPQGSAGSPLVADSLSALMIIVISVAAVSVTVYAKGYLKEYETSRPPAQLSLHYMALVLMFVSMIFVVVCRDAYRFLFAWELMTISSFLLILFDGQRREVRRAALNYLVLMHIGFVFLLAGFVTVSSEGLPASMDSFPAWFGSHNPVPVFLLFLVGFGMKAGMFPLHLWLPEAHPAAPAHISAFMSGVMIKMGAYGLIRLMTAIEEGLFTIGIIVFVLGVITALWGVILAAVQNDIKRLLAYSSIENMGVILISLGASAVGHSTGNEFLAVCAMAGTLLHIVNHSLFKTLLFFGAGNIYSATHTTSLDALGGLSKRMPLTAGLFLLGVGAISALPPLNGFVSEFLIYFGLLDTIARDAGGMVVAVCGVVALSLTGGVVILAFTKLFGVSFLGTARSSAAETAKEVGKWNIAACAIPAAGIIIIGLAPFLFAEGFFGIAADLFEDGSITAYPGISGQMYGIAAACGVLLLVTGLLLWYRSYALKKRTVGRSEVWGCGFTAPSHKMQYSGESFSEGLYGITTSLTKNSGEGTVIDKDEIFPGPHTFDLKHKDKMSTLFSRWWVELVRRINIRVMRLNTGKVNHYILYALLFLVLILLLSVTGVI